MFFKRKWFRWGLLLTISFLLTLVLLGTYDAYRLKTEYPVLIPPKSSKTDPTFKFQKNKPKSWAQLTEISTLAKGAIVISEDWAFFDHHGIDWGQFKDTVRTNLKKHRYARGGSTITQQVAKNLFLGREKTLWRKGRELIWALLLEKIVGKKKILETYFNIVEWGPEIYGISAASNYYFQTSPGMLGAKEGAYLAMLLPNPKSYSRSFRQKQLTPFAQDTIDHILHKMAIAGFLDFDQAKELSYDPLSFEKITESESVPEEMPQPETTPEGIPDGEQN